MSASAKAKARSKGRRMRPARRTARPASPGIPAWAVPTPEEEKALDELHQRVLDGREKLTRVVL